jgi:glycosyltransferase involved in cell wall biosynthesis
MRILILATDIYTRGGIAQYTWTLASALGEFIGPQNVHVLALLGKPGTKETPKNFRILDTITEHLTPSAKIRFAVAALSHARHKYELVICTHVALAPIAAVMHLVFGFRYWVVCHGVEAWRRLPPLERLALKGADLVLPVSSFTAAMLSKVNGIPRAKMRVLYNAISDEFASVLATPNGVGGTSRGGNGDWKVVLSVGMLSKDLAYKGFDVVIRALPRVLEAVPNLRYVIVGEGDNKENLKSLAAEMGVQDKVDFTGELSDAELAACYRACDVFVLPSRTAQRNGHWEGEGFGRVYVEAALASKPVVGSHSGGAAEAVLHGKTGLLVDPISVEAVADAVVTLLTRPELAAKMGDEGRHWTSQSFTQEIMRRTITELLHGNGFRG